MKLRISLLAAVFVIGVIGGIPVAQAARDAAFVNPNLVRNNSGDDNSAIVIEPKSEIDLAETPLNVARRTTLFFINTTPLEIAVESVTTNGDGNVRAAIISDDCTKEGKILPNSRCSVVSEITAIAPGSWSAEVLLTHNSTGRIAKARIFGKGGNVGADKKPQGLMISKQDSQQVIDFDNVKVGDSKAVRSAVMVNDSPEAVKIQSIDLIAAENGLERLDQGCVVDKELKPGEGCPITVTWQPEKAGQISTDLILRHTGILGFLVIPVRGEAQADVSAGKNTDKTDDKLSTIARGSVPLPPSPTDLASLTGAIPAVALSDLKPETRTINADDLSLIGTVGNKAILLLPSNKTAVVIQGQSFDIGSHGQSAKVLSIGLRSVTLLVGERKLELPLRAAENLVRRASAQKGENEAGQALLDTGKSDNGAKAKLPSSVPLETGKP